MRSKPVRNGLNAGTVFGVVIIFLALIGFTVTGANFDCESIGSAPGGRTNACTWLFDGLSRPAWFMEWRLRVPA